MHPALALPALGGVLSEGFLARPVGIVRAAPVSCAGPFLFSFFQGVPDAAHEKLPSLRRLSVAPTTITFSAKSRAGKVQISFCFGEERSFPLA